jgi:hypothetical protein
MLLTHEQSPENAMEIGDRLSGTPGVELSDGHFEIGR